MKKFLYICIGVAVCLVTLSACVKDPTTDAYETNDSKAFFSVGEARMFFEESFADETRSLSESSTAKFLDPGDYTPLWGDAQMSQNATLGSVDVPILAGRKYRAIRSEFRDGRADAYSVDITQDLIVVKSKRTNHVSHYLLTLIPDKDLYAKNKNEVSSMFLNSGDKGVYSGYALYTRNGLVVRLDQYKSGVKVYGVTLLGVSDMSEFNKRMRRVVAKLRKMKFQQKSNISQTRWGEDEWDDLERWANENGIDYREFDNEDDFLNSMIDYYGEPDGGFGGDVLGMRFDEDGTATFYVDTDGDGNADVAFDQFWEDPEPEIHGDNTTTNNGSGGGTGSSSTSGGTTQTDDNNGSSGGSIGGGDNTGDQGTSNSTPKDLSYLHGDETYYYQRHNDALTRGIKPPPSYYLEYGDKYYNRFKNLKPNLSPLGSTWVSDTALGLHIAMTNLLKNNPGIERDEAALKSLAFKTHADVYIKSGITSLPWSDAFLIFIQVDLCDWFSIEAIEQAATVGTAYIEDKSYDKAMEFMQNYNYLEQLIEQKIIDSTTGTRSGQTYTVKDYINAHFGELIVCYEQNYSDFELPN